MTNINLEVSVLLCKKDNSLMPYPCTWDEFRTCFTQECLRTGEKDGEAWIPCSAHDQVGRRCQENMKEAFLLVLDIDTGMALDDVMHRLAGLEALVHSTYSYTPEHPKWRVILPLATPVPVGDLRALFDHMQEHFDGLLDAACGHDTARFFYLPSCPAGNEGLYVSEHLKGNYLDAATVLRNHALRSTALETKKAPPARHLTVSGVSEGNRNNTIFKHACRLFEEGRGTDQVIDACLDLNLRNDPPLDEKEVKRTVKSAEKRTNNAAATPSSNVVEIVERLNTGYAWVAKQGRVYRFHFKDFVSIDHLRQQFANTRERVSIGGGEKWLNHAEIWHQSPKRRTHDSVRFVPGGDVVVDDCINLWEGWGVSPSPGDVAPWNDLLDHLFGGDLTMRQWFEQWTAYPLQHPGAKLSTACVLWSAKQGVGKSMVGETIGKLYGGHFRTITSTELHGAFNGWMRDCQFALGEENSSSSQRADANRLKFLITGSTISVNEKNQPAIELANCANFLFTSNHADAFYLEDADRRYFIWEIVADRKPNEFYERFVDWRDKHGGLAALMDHLLKIDSSGFKPKANAPITQAKQEMIRQSKSDLERWLGEVLEDVGSVKAVFGKEVVHLDELTETYCRERRSRTTTSTAVSRAFQRIARHAKRRVPVGGGRRKNLISLINHEKWDSADIADWSSEYNRPVPVSL